MKRFNYRLGTLRREDQITHEKKVSKGKAYNVWTLPAELRNHELVQPRDNRFTSIENLTTISRYIKEEC